MLCKCLLNLIATDLSAVTAVNVMLHHITLLLSDAAKASHLNKYSTFIVENCDNILHVLSQPMLTLHEIEVITPTVLKPLANLKNEKSVGGFGCCITTSVDMLYGKNANQLTFCYNQLLSPCQVLKTGNLPKSFFCTRNMLKSCLKIIDPVLSLSNQYNFGAHMYSRLC
jgi:hypothetical protein